jgi:hypothetical protein
MPTVRFRVTHPGRVLWTDLETRRIEPDEFALEIVRRVERVVSDVDIAGQGKGELAVSE